MALVDDLKGNVALRIDALNADAAARDEMKKIVNDLSLLQPNGLKAFTLSSEWLIDFAGIIRNSIYVAASDKLLPFVTVYGAAFGMVAVYSRILFAWIQTPSPQSIDAGDGTQAEKDAEKAQIKAELDELIDMTITAYVGTIVM